MPTFKNYNEFEKFYELCESTNCSKLDELDKQKEAENQFNIFSDNIVNSIKNFN